MRRHPPVVVRIVRGIVVAASALMLVGCTSMFAPDPTRVPSPVTTSEPAHTFAAVSCAPETSRFEWSAAPSTGVSYEAISTQYQSYGKHLEGGSAGVADVELSVHSIEPSKIFDLISADQEQWNGALLPSLTGSRLVPDGFGQVAGMMPLTKFFPPRPHTGLWVRAVVAPVISLGMTVRCEDGSSASGIISGPIPTGEILTLHCDNKTHPKDSAQLTVARAQCASF